ncbi:cytochrome c-type biogenesis protein CcmH [Deinococcus sp. QL22]|nr:cytochrome c-type biogenesis protein [Deinococcus sp. QL22]UQN07766.1 cytochrome c-type biogenesis protein CcmH [Deinococcus sp. QL22]
MTLAFTLGAAAYAAAPLTPQQEAQARQIATNLRCPICTGVPITESTNDISREMLRDVREQVAAGRSARDVYAYFSARYGDFVLLDPPKEGTNLLLWGAPLAALGGGGAVLWLFLRRRQGAVAPAAQAEQSADEPFDSFLAQVRRDTGRSSPDQNRTDQNEGKS